MYEIVFESYALRIHIAFNLMQFEALMIVSLYYIENYKFIKSLFIDDSFKFELLTAYIWRIGLRSQIVLPQLKKYFVINEETKRQNIWLYVIGNEGTER